LIFLDQSKTLPSQRTINPSIQGEVESAHMPVDSQMPAESPATVDTAAHGVLDQQQLRIAIESRKYEQWHSLHESGLTDSQIDTLQEHPKNVAFLLEQVMLGNIVSYKAF